MKFESTDEMHDAWVRLYRVPLRDAIDIALKTDEDAFVPFGKLADEARAWHLADEDYRRYRKAATIFGTMLELALERAVGFREHGPEIVDIDEALDSAEGLQCPRWPSGIDALDEETGGGFYGATVVAGEPGTGKSLVAIRSALRAAAQGWRVVYLDSELGVENIKSRLNALRKGDQQDYDRVMNAVHRRLHFASLDTLRSGLGAIYNHVVKRIEAEDERLLVVVDHVHDTARGMQRAGVQAAGGEFGFYRMIEAIGDAAKQSRRETDGMIGWLLVAELNAAGRVRGGQLDYAGEMVVSLRKPKDLRNAGNVTEVIVTKGREGGEKHYGQYFRNHELCRLSPMSDREPDPGSGDDGGGF